MAASYNIRRWIIAFFMRDGWGALRGFFITIAICIGASFEFNFKYKRHPNFYYKTSTLIQQIVYMVRLHFLSTVRKLFNHISNSIKPGFQVAEKKRGNKILNTDDTEMSKNIKDSTTTCKQTLSKISLFWWNLLEKLALNMSNELAISVIGDKISTIIRIIQSLRKKNSQVVSTYDCNMLPQVARWIQNSVLLYYKLVEYTFTSRSVRSTWSDYLWFILLFSFNKLYPTSNNKKAKHCVYKMLSPIKQI